MQELHRPVGIGIIPLDFLTRRHAMTNGTTTTRVRGNEPTAFWKAAGEVLKTVEGYDVAFQGTPLVMALHFRRAACS